MHEPRRIRHTGRRNAQPGSPAARAERSHAPRTLGERVEDPWSCAGSAGELGGGSSSVRLVLLRTPTVDVLSAVRELSRATGLSESAACEAVLDAGAHGWALLLEAHLELAELHAERCRDAGWRVRLEAVGSSATL